MRSPRLTYRPIDARDAGRIAVLAGDWDVARMTSRIPHPYSLIDADLWIASIGDDEFVRGVERDGELIGAVGYISGEPEQAEIGYWIGKPWWGNGYATEAAGTLMKLLLRRSRFPPAHLRALRRQPRLGPRYRQVGLSPRRQRARSGARHAKVTCGTVRYARRRPLLASWRRPAQ